MSTTIVIKPKHINKPPVYKPSKLDTVLELKTEYQRITTFTIESHMADLKRQLDDIEYLYLTVQKFNKKYLNSMSLTMPYHFSVKVTLNPLYEGTTRRLASYLLSNSNFRMDPTGPNIIYYNEHNYQISDRYYRELADLLNKFLKEP